MVGEGHKGAGKIFEREVVEGEFSRDGRSKKAFLLRICKRSRTKITETVGDEEDKSAK
jgi:hypothetical protein